VERGVRLFDSAEAYGRSQRKELLGEARSFPRARMYPQQIWIRIIPDGTRYGLNSRPEHISSAEHRQRFGSSHRPVTSIVSTRMCRLEEVAVAHQGMIAQGKVRHFGLSEQPQIPIRRAHAVRASDRRAGASIRLWTEIRKLKCYQPSKNLGLALCHSARLGAGFLTGKNERNLRNSTRSDFRMRAPRFTTIRTQNQQASVDLLEKVADEKVQSVRRSLRVAIGSEPWIVSNSWHEKVGALGRRTWSGIWSTYVRDIREIALASEDNGARGPDQSLLAIRSLRENCSTP